MTSRKLRKTTGSDAGTPRTDTGWAWVVECGAFVVCFASYGYNSSLSVYLNIWMDYFDTNAVTAGLVMSMTTLVRGIMSPIAGALCSKFGPRIVTMVGGVIYVTGFVMASQAPSIEFLIVAIGFVGAMGQSVVYVATVHALGMYFKKRFAFAVGLASAGISVGQLAVPPLVTYMIDIYGWKGSFLITSAIALNIVVAGALFRPMVRKRRKKKRMVNTNGTDGESVSRTAQRKESNRSRDCDSVGCRDITVSDEDETDKIESDHDTMILVKNRPGHVVRATGHFVVSTLEEGGNPIAVPERPESSTQGLPFLSYLSRVKHFLLYTYGLGRLVRNAPYIVLISAAFLHGFARLGIVYIVPRANSVDIDFNSSAFLLSFFGIGSFVGRISHGWFIDKRYITGEMAYSLSLFIFCVAVTVMPALVTFVPLAILCLLLGSMAGMSSSVVMVIARSLVHPTDASEALGIMLFFASVGNVLGIFVAGIVYDNTESYDAAFFVAGGVLLTASLLCIVVYFLQKAKRKRNRVFLPTAFYVKLPRRDTVDGQLEQAEASVTIGPDSRVDGLNSNDAGITNPLFMLGLSEVSTSDYEAVARNSDKVDDQFGQLVTENNSIRHGVICNVTEVNGEELEGIENPLAVDLDVSEFVGATAME